MKKKLNLETFKFLDEFDKKPEECFSFTDFEERAGEEVIGELFYQSNQTVESEVSYIDGPSMSSKTLGRY